MVNRLQQLLMFITLCILSAAGGCMDSIADDREQMEMVLETFPSAVGVSEMYLSRGVESSSRPGNAVISEIRATSGLLGYCVESDVTGRSGPFIIRVLVNPQLTVVRAAVISYPWARGRDVCRPAFTDQFRGKGPDDSIEIGKDIDAVSGATISCDAMAGGVREALRQLEQLRLRQE